MVFNAVLSSIGAEACRRRSGADQAVVDFRVEDRHALPIGGEGVTVAVWSALDQPVGV